MGSSQDSGRDSHIHLVQPRMCVRTGATKKKGKRVLVAGDSVLRGIEAPVCRPHKLSREVCCLLVVIIHDTKKMLLGMGKVTDYCPFLLFHFIHRRLQ